MSLQKQIDDLVSQRASQWVDILRRNDSQDHAAFVAWVSESPRHLDEFLTMSGLDRELEARSLYAGIDRAELLGRIAPAAVASLRSLPRLSPKARGRPSGWRRWMVPLLAASVAAMGFVALMKGDGLFLPRELSTGVGELRSLELPDGSLVSLSAHSRLRLRFDDTMREIRLIEGEALFKVARDPSRAFQVRTRDAVVKALGTEFNVAARESGTQVAVLEGRVQVAPVTRSTAKATALKSGDAAQVARKGTVQVTPRANVASAVAWRERRLVFVKAPLEEIVEEFNRFNRKRLRLEGIMPGARHYSGTFNADDPQALVAFLVKERDLTVEEGVGEIVIRGR